MAPYQTQLATFTCFLELAPELRAMIWVLAAGDLVNNPQIFHFDLVRLSSHGGPPLTDEFRPRPKSWVRRAYLSIHSIQMASKEAHGELAKKLSDRFVISRGIFHFDANKDIILFSDTMAYDM